MNRHSKFKVAIQEDHAISSRHPTDSLAQPGGYFLTGEGKTNNILFSPEIHLTYKCSLILVKTI